MGRVLVVLLLSLVLCAGCRGAGAGRAVPPGAPASSSATTAPVASTPGELDASTAQDQHLASSQPDLATVAPQSARSGDAIRRRLLTATDSDSGCAALRFSAVHLPTGLVISNRGDCTAMVEGTLAAPAGRYAVVYSVTDETGSSDSTTSIFTVGAAR